jgi:hypothetical protein
MATNQFTDIPDGWVGGFAESNPAFSYESPEHTPQDPNLTSLEMKGNMDNIGLLQRQQSVNWPEFSWETLKDEVDTKRCFQMFAPDISRIGYTDEGRIYSIICPQQGVYIHDIGYMNVEVTVTGQRGWVNETTKELAADMTVEGKIWFSKGAHQSSKGAFILDLYSKLSKHPFPSTKANAIRVSTHHPGDVNQPIFPVRKGESTLFESPDFAKHTEAWAIGNIEVEIGEIVKTGDDKVDEFNKEVMRLFNLTSGNMLQTGNVLCWNLWFDPPSLVNTEEWQNHAEKWRESIDTDHGSPDGEGTNGRYFDGTPFSVEKFVIEEAIEDLIKLIKNALENK